MMDQSRQLSTKELLFFICFVWVARPRDWLVYSYHRTSLALRNHWSPCTSRAAHLNYSARHVLLMTHTLKCQVPKNALNYRTASFSFLPSSGSWMVSSLPAGEHHTRLKNLTLAEILGNFNHENIVEVC